MCLPPQVVLWWSDQRLQSLVNGTASWLRDESLSTIVSSQFMELPGEKLGDSSSSAAAGSSSEPAEGTVAAAAAQGDGGSSGSSAFWDWLRYQQLSVMVQFKLNSPADSVELYHLRQRLRCVAG